MNNDNLQKTSLLSKLKESTYKLINGYGLYEDYICVKDTLTFCEIEFENNPALGFGFELNIIKSNLLDIFTRVCSLDDPNPQINWISPYILLNEKNNIIVLNYLLVEQFLFEPKLDPNVKIQINSKYLDELIGINDNYLEDCNHWN